MSQPTLKDLVQATDQLSDLMSQLTAITIEHNERILELQTELENFGWDVGKLFKEHLEKSDDSVLLIWNEGEWQMPWVVRGVFPNGGKFIGLRPYKEGKAELDRLLEAKTDDDKD